MPGVASRLGFYVLSRVLPIGLLGSRLVSLDRAMFFIYADDPMTDAWGTRSWSRLEGFLVEER